MSIFRTLLPLLIGCLLLSAPEAGSQTPDSLVFSVVDSFPYPAPYSAYTARFDRLGRPYIYTANKEYGVVFFKYTPALGLHPVRVFMVTQFQNLLKPTDLVQRGQYLYVALGDFESLSPQAAGLAIIDLTDPESATILGQWNNPTFNKGCAAICVDSTHAYLALMEKGILVLDVSDPSAPAFTSKLALDLNWPAPPGLFNVPHARGLALRDTDLWVSFDAGGLRRVDVSDKLFPKETARYLNPALDAVAQPAYNSANLVGDYLFAAVDYCGLDVVDISTPAQPQNAAWINPWNCTNSSWNGSPGHSNQVATARHDSLLFLSGADTELLAYSISTPGQPRPIGQWGALQDSVATWGLDANDSLVVLTQLWSPLDIPFVAQHGGLKLLRYRHASTSTSIEPTPDAPGIGLAPNPVRDLLHIHFPDSGAYAWTLIDALGRVVMSGRQAAGEARTRVLDLQHLPAGAYRFGWQAGRSAGSRLLLKP